MNARRLDWKSVCLGVALGVGISKLWKYRHTGSSKSNKKVLCIEIGGTSSRFAIFTVCPNKKTIAQTSEIIKKCIDSPDELVALVKGTFTK